jgi:O-antigen/teichoic acid export membrane protein
MTMTGRRNTVAQGTLYLAASSTIFITCTFIMHICLGRILNPDNYGIYGLVFSVLVWLEILLGGISGATVKTIAQYPSDLARIQKDSVRLILLVAAAIFLLGLLGSPLLARLFNQPDINFYLRIAIIDIPFLAAYKVHISMLNGLKQYGQQSLASIAYIFSKLVFIVGFILLGFSITGALIGNIFASMFGFLLAVYYVHTNRPAAEAAAPSPAESSPGFSRLARMAVPFTIYSLLFNTLMSMDLWMVQGMMSDASQTGYYVAAVNLARSLFFVFSAISLALFPAIAGSILRGEPERTRDYIERTFRTLFLLLVPICIFIAATSVRLVTLVYSARYAPASSPLTLLAFSYALFAIIIACITILISNNNFREVLLIEAFLVAMVVLLCALLIPRYGLKGAAFSTLVTCAIGLLACMASIWRRFRITVKAGSLLRILASSILASSLLLVPAKGLLLPLIYVAAGAAYLLLIWLVGEVGPQDLAFLRNLARRTMGK